jgi:hypothetical protein
VLKNSLSLQNDQIWGIEKCLRKSITSFIRHPDAILFLRISRKGVLQQPQSISPTTGLLVRTRFFTNQDALAQLIADVYAGKLHPRVAAGLAPLMSLQLRMIETTDLARRLADLEKLLGKQPSTLSGSGHAPRETS